MQWNGNKIKRALVSDYCLGHASPLRHTVDEQWIVTQAVADAACKVHRATGMVAGIASSCMNRSCHDTNRWFAIYYL